LSRETGTNTSSREDFHSTLEGVAGLTAGEFGSTRVEVIGYKLAHSGYMEVLTRAA
jgi:hypothetical protein